MSKESERIVNDCQASQIVIVHLDLNVNTKIITYKKQKFNIQTM